MLNTELKRLQANLLTKIHCDVCFSNYILDENYSLFFIFTTFKVRNFYSFVTHEKRSNRNYQLMFFQEAILWAMDRATKFIYIAVNEYLPMDVYKDNRYWPVIDDKIKEGNLYF